MKIRIIILTLLILLVASCAPREKENTYTPKQVQELVSKSDSTKKADSLKKAEDDDFDDIIWFTIIAM